MPCSLRKDRCAVLKRQSSMSEEGSRRELKQRNIVSLDIRQELGSCSC